MQGSNNPHSIFCDYPFDWRVVQYHMEEPKPFAIWPNTYYQIYTIRYDRISDGQF